MWVPSAAMRRAHSSVESSLMSTNASQSAAMRLRYSLPSSAPNAYIVTLKRERSWRPNRPTHRCVVAWLRMSEET
jgi:hypothetical protein